VSDEAELEAVRRLLAQARHEEPMPDDVAVRMNALLDDLSRERGRDPVAAPVASLELHRRRRAAALLVAAAAIVVGGVTAAQHLPLGSGSSRTAAGSATEGASAGGDRHVSTSAPPEKSPPVSPGPLAPTQRAKLRTRGGRVVVRPGHFTADALSGRQAAGPTPGALLNAERLRSIPAGCLPALGKVEAVPATYERAPAALVYHPPAGTTQVVDLYICGTPKPVRSVTLPTS
jgi:hypothetical protein